MLRGAEAAPACCELAQLPIRKQGMLPDGQVLYKGLSVSQAAGSLGFVGGLSGARWRRRNAGRCCLEKS